MADGCSRGSLVVARVGAHRGALHLASEPGRGTTITFTLPIVGTPRACH